MPLSSRVTLGKLLDTILKSLLLKKDSCIHIRKAVLELPYKIPQMVQLKQKNCAF